MKELKENFLKCPQCNYHVRIGSDDYFQLIFDGVFEELFTDLRSTDMLKFVDLKPYHKRLDEAYKKTDLTEAISVAKGKVNRKPLVICAMDFTFIGGSMGSVVGQKIALAIDHCRETRTPLLIISKTGGARMMESAYSLMQMAKTSAKLSQLAKEQIPYFSLLTDPTTGGVTASFAMLGDINFAEPEALIGFAGPRVIKETIKKDLPEGFQTSEFLLEHGFLDFIVDRKDLRERIADLLSFFD
jgi:acetyl-CoA carboxylase carboxyl transferase subunit beta